MLTPKGKHMMMTGVRQLPFRFDEGTWDDHRDAFTERVLDVLTRCAPRVRHHVIDTYTIAPLDRGHLRPLARRGDIFVLTYGALRTLSAR